MTITKRRLLLTCATVAVVLTAGCVITSRLLVMRAIQDAIPADSRQILDHSQQFFLLSLDPHPDMSARETSARPFFHDTLIVRQTLVTDPRDRADLLAAFYTGIGEGSGDKMACFDPQFGIRAVRNGQSVDLVICYECLQVLIYDRHGLRGASTSASPLQTFRRVGTRNSTATGP